MKDQELILGLLARVARRLWLNRCLQQLGFVVSLALLAWLAYWLLEPAFSALPFQPLALLAGCAVLTLCVLYVLRRALNRFTLAQAAGVVDTQAQLKDELKTAYWLATRDAETPFAALQIERAARTSSGIDPARVVPTRFPQSAWSALLLGVLMILTALWQPPSAHSWYGPHALSRASPDARALLDGTQDPSARELSEALAVLEDETASLQAREQALAQARQAQDEIDLRAAAARDTLARLAGAMAGREDTRQAGEALAQGRTAEALEMLEQLAGETALEPAQGNELKSDVQQADVKVNQEALQQVLKDIQDAQSAVDTQSRTAQVRRRMENFLVAATQGRSLTAARFGNQASTPAATPAPETGNADLQGGSMFRQGAVARGEDPSESQEGAKTGAASGDAEALPLEGVRTERLEAKLKRERVAAADDGTESESEEWIYKPTQGSGAQTRFSDARGLERFAEAGAPERERIPLGQRQLVRDYFLNLHQSEQQRQP
jgi:hypothetical protein